MPKRKNVALQPYPGELMCYDKDTKEGDELIIPFNETKFSEDAILK